MAASSNRVHRRLMAPVAAFNDNVVDDSLEAGVAIELRAERRALLVPVIALTQRHDIVRFERVDNAGYRIESLRDSGQHFLEMLRSASEADKRKMMG